VQRPLMSSGQLGDRHPADRSL